MASLTDSLIKALLSRLGNPHAFQEALTLLDEQGIEPSHLEGEGAQAIIRYIQENKGITAFALQSHLKASNKALKDYLADITQLPIDSPVAFDVYCQQIKGDYAHRQALAQLASIWQQRETVSPMELLEATEALASLLMQADSDMPSGLISHAEAVALAQAEVLAMQAGDSNTLSTGCLPRLSFILASCTNARPMTLEAAISSRAPLLSNRA